MFGLTEAQRDCLAILQELTDQNGGIAPSLEEIAHELDLQSRSGAIHLLAGLDERGWITRDPGKPLSIRILRRVALPEESEFVGLFDAPHPVAAIGG